jgi:hypothetical protein
MLKLLGSSIISNVSEVCCAFTIRVKWSRKSFVKAVCQSVRPFVRGYRFLEA